MRKILIVGSASYIGNSFGGYIKDTTVIKNISVRDNQWKQMDFSEFDTILFCAALVHQKEKVYTEAEYQKINCELPVAFAKKAKAEGVSQFVFLSSMAVYGLDGKVGETLVIGKGSAPNPKSYYGKSKYQAELLLSNEKSASFIVTIVRPPMVYGENCPGNYQRLKRLVLKYKVFPAIKNQRSMISIQMLCKALERLIWDRQGGIFHPQDAEYICVLEMAKKIASEGRSKLYISRLLSIGVYLSSPFLEAVNKVWGGLIYDKQIDKGTKQNEKEKAVG